MIRSLLMLLLLLAITYAVIVMSRAMGAEANFRWNPNTEPDIAGYILLVGNAPGEWTREIAVGNVSTATVNHLASATLYHASIKAVNIAGMESEESTPITFTTAAEVPPMERSGWVATASSEETGFEDNRAVNALDGNDQTLWHTTWNATIPPHSLVIELPRSALLSGLNYLPRQDGGTNGIVTGYEIETSIDGVEWVASTKGTWASNNTEKHATLPLVEARFVRLWGNDSRMAAAEVTLEGVYVPEPPMSFTYTYEQSDDLTRWSTLDIVPPIIVPKDMKKEFTRLRIETTKTTP